jgi:hypothetical protein
VADLSVPDDTNFNTGTGFTKTWRIRNDGACAWTTDYSLVFDHGYALGGPTSVPLPAIVLPGSTIDLSVNLVAPSADGFYQGFWMLQDPKSARFGIGADASRAFWVKISAGPLPSPTVSVTGGCVLEAISPPNVATYGVNNDMDIKWTIENTSGSTWTRDAVDYKFLGGTKMYKYNDTYDLPVDVPSGNTIDIIVDTMTPSTPGFYTTTWGIVQESTVLCSMSITLYIK